VSQCARAHALLVFKPVISNHLSSYIRSLPIKPRIKFKSLYPQATPLALDLLEKMLCFDPARRITCQEALEHPYFSVWHDPVDEPSCEVPFDFGFEREDSTNGMRDLIVEEVRSFRNLVRQHAVPVEPAHPQGGHDLPKAPAPPQQPGAGVGPAFNEVANNAVDKEEHPSSALERELQHGVAVKQ
jgi:mitogen-activated protein kinase 7